MCYTGRDEVTSTLIVCVNYGALCIFQFIGEKAQRYGYTSHVSLINFNVLQYLTIGSNEFTRDKYNTRSA